MGFNDINLQVSGPQQPASIYKTKVLKGQVPFATQVTEPNTKYVIKHNFELDADVTIPENCVLEFDGGSINGNYTIDFNNCVILSDENAKLFVLNDFNNLKKYSVKWFGAKGDGITDDTNILRKLLTKQECISIIPCGTYIISGAIDAIGIKNSWIGEESDSLKELRTFESLVTFKCIGDNNGEPFLYFPKFVKNLNIIGEVGDNYHPKYTDSIGVQIGKPGNFSQDGLYNNIYIGLFGIGTRFNCTAVCSFQNSRISENYTGVLIDIPTISGVDSGYITYLNFDKVSLSNNFTQGLNRTATGVGLCVIHFNNGYIEYNTIDDNNVYEVELQYKTQIYFDNLYSECNNNFLKFRNNGEIKNEFAIFHNCYLPRVKSIHIDKSSISLLDTYAPLCNIENYTGRIEIINSDINNIIGSDESIGHGTSSGFEALNGGLNIINSVVTALSGEAFNSVVRPYALTSDNMQGPRIDRQQTGILCYVKDKHRLLTYVTANNKFYDVEGNEYDTLHKGTTLERPQDVNIGYFYLDTTINKPIWYDGTQWVDATGATV